MPKQINSRTHIKTFNLMHACKILGTYICKYVCRYMRDILICNSERASLGKRNLRFSVHSLPPPRIVHPSDTFNCKCLFKRHVFSVRSLSLSLSVCLFSLLALRHFRFSQLLHFYFALGPFRFYSAFAFSTLALSMPPIRCSQVVYSIPHHSLSSSLPYCLHPNWPPNCSALGDLVSTIVVYLD